MEEDKHRNFLKEQWDSRFDVLEHMVDELREDSFYKNTPAAMRAISVALAQLETAQMWVNKALYSNQKEDK